MSAPETPTKVRPPLAREVVKTVAIEHGVCIRPVAMRPTDLAAGETAVVNMPGPPLDLIVQILAYGGLWIGEVFAPRRGRLRLGVSAAPTQASQPGTTPVPWPVRRTTPRTDWTRIIGAGRGGQALAAVSPAPRPAATVWMPDYAD